MKLRLLYLSDGQTRVKALEKTTDEIRGLYHDVTITYKIDIVEQTEGLMTIQGWVLGMFHDEQIRLVDESGGEIPHEMMRIIRTDVNKAYGVAKEAENEQCGFQIRIKRKETDCREYHLQFSNCLTMKEYVVDLKKFDYEHSKRGKLKKLLAPARRKENRAYIREHGMRAFISHIQRGAGTRICGLSDLDEKNMPSAKGAEGTTESCLCIPSEDQCCDPAVQHTFCIFERNAGFAAGTDISERGVMPGRRQHGQKCRGDH